jgi:putative ABC transport system permease protein
MVLYIRTAGVPAPVLGLAQRAAQNVDPQVAVRDASTVRELMDNNLWIARLVVALFASLGLLALALASVGLYGVLAYTVERRRREIGVRMALGATRFTVARFVLLRGLLVVVVGMAIGLGLGLLAARALASVLPSVAAADPVTFGGSAVVLVGVAAFACWTPARRASRLNPMAALREG